MERTTLVAGNWKMHKSRGEALAFCRELAPFLTELDEVDLAICPPATALDIVAAELGDLGVGVWAQTISEHPHGAFTGEVSAQMALDAGASGALVGHSERRHVFGEDDAVVNAKLLAALAAGLDPVLCVGETEEQRDAGETAALLRAQVEAGLAGLDAARADQVTVAYEPVWAIGTGRTATPEQAQEAHALIRALLSERFGEETALTVRILYGGSVKPDNARSLLDQPDVDGALVGGASLEAPSLAAIARAGLPG
jgi:triosephosphate isomerase